MWPWTHSLWAQSDTHALGLVNINYHTKFGVSSFTYSKNTIGPKVKKWVTWPLLCPFQKCFVIRSLGLPLINPCAKYEVSNSTGCEDMQGNTKWESTIIPAKAIAEFIDRYLTLPFADMIQRASVNVNNGRFTEFFDRYFHIPLPIATKHELGLPFPPRNLRIKFGPNPSIIFLVIVVTDRHTHT